MPRHPPDSIERILSYDKPTPVLESDVQLGKDQPCLQWGTSSTSHAAPGNGVARRGAALQGSDLEQDTFAPYQAI
ncbi:hypothetical protein Q9233_012937 [Columba guinea]|nr:hypothetical protein Q9233_012937 [Columba guinea]